MIVKNICINQKESGDIVNEGFILNNDYKVLELSKGYCKMEGSVTDKSLNPYKIAHGGYLFGLADTAAGLAASTIHDKSVTVNSTIDFFHFVKDGKIISEAKCIKEGKTISVFDVSIHDEKENLVARSTVTFIAIK